jgi:hypothetical protein
MKAWVTPQLIVLVRNNPQEAVLDACKGSPALAAGVVPSDDFSGCRQYPNMLMSVICLDCFSISVS